MFSTPTATTSPNRSPRYILLRDHSTGSLAITQSESGEVARLAMLTNLGRVMTVDIASGKINWMSPPVATGSGALDIADVDGDGREDVLVPGLNTFAVALSGIDGSVIWRSDDSPDIGSVASKVLVTTKTRDGRLLIAAGDPRGRGFKTMEVPEIAGTQIQK